MDLWKVQVGLKWPYRLSWQCNRGDSWSRQSPSQTYGRQTCKSEERSTCRRLGRETGMDQANNSTCRTVSWCSFFEASWSVFLQRPRRKCSSYRNILKENTMRGAQAEEMHESVTQKARETKIRMNPWKRGCFIPGGGNGDRRRRVGGIYSVRSALINSSMLKLGKVERRKHEIFLSGGLRRYSRKEVYDLIWKSLPLPPRFTIFIISIDTPSRRRNEQVVMWRYRKEPLVLGGLGRTLTIHLQVDWCHTTQPYSEQSSATFFCTNTDAKETCVEAPLM